MNGAQENIAGARRCGPAVTNQGTRHMPDKAQVLEALRTIQDPDLGQDIVSLGFVKNLKIEDGCVAFQLELTTAACPVRDEFKSRAESLIAALPGVIKVAVTLTARPSKPRSGPNLQNLEKIGVIIAVSSCKGGVGKSTVAAQIARVMHAEGYRVGLLDADIYGPSVPMLFRLQMPELQVDGKEIQPVDVDGLKVMSIGFLMGDQPAVLRGPIIASYVQQILLNTRWGDLDYLIIDMPPGTGDIQLTLTQTASLDGALIVTTPHQLSLADVARGIIMFEKVKVPVLGIVENMSTFICDGCSKEHRLFGPASKTLKERFGIDTLAELPLAPAYATVMPRSLADYPEPLRRLADRIHRKIGMQRLEKTSPPVVEPLPEGQIRIRWPDGTVSDLPAVPVRASCRCAQCIDEFTGKPRLDPAQVPEDIQAVKIEPLGNYAVAIIWSDGHASGIFTFDHLRALTDQIAVREGAR